MLDDSPSKNDDQNIKKEQDKYIKSDAKVLLYYKFKYKLKLFLNLAIINSELNCHEEAFDLAKNAAFSGIILLKKLF